MTVLPGVYRIAGAPESGRQAAMATVLWAGTAAAVSHLSAALLWGLARAGGAARSYGISTSTRADGVSTWRLIRNSELPRPVRQHRVRAEGRWYRFDFAWLESRVAVECEGFDHHGRRSAFAQDRPRTAALAAEGWRLVPVTWREVTDHPARLVARLPAAVASPFIETSDSVSRSRVSMKST
ncbi:MAG: DUF559 domain-containing protein [Actinobacteria bacterium]|nr:DUF559 domain-containing protein [Actinomycetota bacterium]